MGAFGSFIRPLIGLGTSIFSMFNGAGAESETAARIKDATNKANTLQGPALSFIDASRGAFDTASNFWTPIAQGDRTKSTSVLAPDINRINEQFDANQQAAAGTRTGAGAATSAALPYAKQAQIQSLFSTLRPQAAKEVASIGGQEGQLGGSFMNTLLQALEQATNQNLKNRQLSFEQGQNIGGGLLGSAGDLMSSIFGLKKNKSGAAPGGGTIAGWGGNNAN